MLLADRSLATFDFESEQLKTGYRTPLIVQDITREALDKLVA